MTDIEDTRECAGCEDVENGPHSCGREVKFYTIAPLYASPAQLALAHRYSTLEGAFADIRPRTVVRDSSGAVVAGHADQLDLLTPANIS